MKAFIADRKREAYAVQVVRMFNDYEELVFNLSEQSANETIESIKNMSHGQRLKLQELLTKRNQRNIKQPGKDG